jgi:quinolinate synthase
MLSSSLVCPDMKKTTLGDIYNSLADDGGGYAVELPQDIIIRANLPLEKMLKLS